MGLEECQDQGAGALGGSKPCTQQGLRAAMGLGARLSQALGRGASLKLNVRSKDSAVP